MYGSLIYYQTCSRDKRSGVLAGVAQLAEQLICNQQVAGSSPITGLKKSCKKPKRKIAGVSRPQRFFFLV